MHGLYWGFGNMPRFATDCWYGFTGGSLWSWGLMIGTFLLAIVAVVLLAVLLNRQKRGTKEESASLRILHRRYANGEIDRDAFESMKKDLR